MYFSLGENTDPTIIWNDVNQYRDINIFPIKVFFKYYLNIVLDYGKFRVFHDSQDLCNQTLVFMRKNWQTIFRVCVFPKNSLTKVSCCICSTASDVFLFMLLLTVAIALTHSPQHNCDNSAPCYLFVVHHIFLFA